jgi:hypothetical protein
MSIQSEQGKPPLFKSWKGWYTFVLLILLAQIIFFYWLTRQFS